ncbi:hypothetical protein LTR86_002762 [Recurvomyces mirabilis]|nr:hypothetical protein LTR86_002762 [Recurvomyces mirabilis]
MLPPGLRTPREAVLYYDQVYFDLINNGKAHPFVYPWVTVGAAVIIGYLLIDHRKSPWLQWARWPVFAFLCLFQGWCIATNRARHCASAFGVGLLSFWGTLWVAAIMIANDCQRDFKRIERRSDTTERFANNDTNGSTSAVEQKELNARKSRPTAQGSDGSSDGKHNESRDELAWQEYPSGPLIARLDWVADCFCSFRGVGWNWQTSGIPPPPQWAQTQLGDTSNTDNTTNDSRYTKSRTGIRRFFTRADLLRDCLICLASTYFILDFTVTLMHRDPYFVGYTTAPAPTHLPQMIQNSHFLTKSFRLLLSLTGIYTALYSIFKLGPLFFGCLLGPKVLGLRGEAWMNPADMFGSYIMILDKGLAGWWGGWWHQTFRYGFEAPATATLAATGIEKKSTKGRLVSLCIAFFLSGCVHACGSYTQLGDTRPLLGPMQFFLLQAVGIMVQTVATHQLKAAGILEKCPKLLKQAANFALVHVWLYYTAPLLVDDFAQGGVWLFEPLPFSVLRGLGFGAVDDQFFCWWHGLFWWRTGKHWWDTGIAL